MRLLQSTGEEQADNLAGTTSNKTFNSNVLPGSKVIATTNHYNNGTTQRITAINMGGTGGTRRVEKVDTSGANDNYAEVWDANNVAGNSTNFNFTLGGAGHYYTASAQEWRGVYDFDQSGTGGIATSSAPAVTAGGATAQDDELVYAVFTDYIGTNWTSATPPSGYTEVHDEPDGTTHEAGSAAYGKLTAIATPTATFATGASMSWISAMATFRAYGPGHSYNLHAMNAGGSSLTTPATTFDTVNGRTVLVCIGRGDVTDHASNSVTDNKSNAYTLQTVDGSTTKTYTDWPSAGTALYANTNITGGAAHTWTVAKPDVNDEVTILAVEVVGTVIQDAQWNEDLTGPTNVSDSVTTTDAAWLVCFWWGDDSNGEANPAVDEGSGWRKVEWTTSVAGNHVQAACAVRRVTGAGSYSCTWTPSTSQGAQMYIIAVQASGGGGGTINTKTLTDTLTIGDERVRQFMRDRVVENFITTQDTRLRDLSLTRQLENSIIVSEPAIQRERQNVVEVITSIDEISDELTKSYRRTRIIGDTITLIDLISAVTSSSRVVVVTQTDSLVVVDSSIKTRERGKWLTDTLATNEAIIKGVAKTRQNLDVLTVEDGVTMVRRYNAQIGDFIVLNDAMTKLITEAVTYEVNIEVGVDMDPVVGAED